MNNHENVLKANEDHQNKKLISKSDFDQIEFELNAAKNALAESKSNNTFLQSEIDLLNVELLQKNNIIEDLKSTLGNLMFYFLL